MSFSDCFINKELTRDDLQFVFFLEKKVASPFSSIFSYKSGCFRTEKTRIFDLRIVFLMEKKFASLFNRIFNYRTGDWLLEQAEVEIAKLEKLQAAVAHQQLVVNELCSLWHGLDSDVKRLNPVSLPKDAGVVHPPRIIPGTGRWRNRGKDLSADPMILASGILGFDDLDNMFREHWLLPTLLVHFITNVNFLAVGCVFYQLISRLILMRNNIGSYSTPLGLSFILDVSGFSGLVGLELPKRCCDPFASLDYGRLSGGALALGPSELLDDTTIWDPPCAVKFSILKTRRIIPSVFYVIAIVKEYSGIFFFSSFFFFFRWQCWACKAPSQ